MSDTVEAPLLLLLVHGMLLPCTLLMAWRGWCDRHRTSPTELFGEAFAWSFVGCLSIPVGAPVLSGVPWPSLVALAFADEFWFPRRHFIYDLAIPLCAYVLAQRVASRRLAVRGESAVDCETRLRDRRHDEARAQRLDRRRDERNT